MQSKSVWDPASQTSTLKVTLADVTMVATSSLMTLKDSVSRGHLKPTNWTVKNGGSMFSHIQVRLFVTKFLSWKFNEECCLVLLQTRGTFLLCSMGSSNSIVLVD